MIQRVLPCGGDTRLEPREQAIDQGPLRPDRRQDGDVDVLRETGHAPAVINLSGYSRYDNGTMTAPELESFVYSDTSRERVDTEEYHREILSQEAFQKLQALSDKIVSILAKHRIQVLDESVLNLRVPGLKASRLSSRGQCPSVYGQNSRSRGR